VGLGLGILWVSGLTLEVVARVAEDNGKKVCPEDGGRVLFVLSLGKIRARKGRPVSLGAGFQGLGDCFMFPVSTDVIRAWKESTVSEKRGSRVQGLSGASRSV